ncbi:stoned-A [Culex quinquefasciatus]|uniref:Stoned-A n=1 Tax=Culex quinquefasciatus TaxID=7176 RepID=B0WH24_CULQU|nr:stoned-A [Culex quinquefasciatus]|eukprot:XP_001848008.1 stoned-A [Culex quinquefasciatus]
MGPQVCACLRFDVSAVRIMLKLPKGLKKKKKGKKSKKDQELFTEEELEQYRREHQSASALNSAAPSDTEDHPGEKSGENDEEWSKFAALTTGIDSVLKKTQQDLGRIKESSFFQKQPTKVELEAKEREEQAQREREEQERAKEAAKEAEEKRAAEELINAVVELSDSEPNSEVEEDIFDTNYTDAIASGELPIAYVPESPELEEFEGPDPFDTSYADKVIKGPEVSKRGKKIVNIGAAVQVLTGRVENVSTTAKSRPKPRRGPKNLLLESFDDGEAPDGAEAGPSEPAQPALLSLLDDPSELPSDAPIDLSVSLHIALQKDQESKQELEAEPEFNLDEFDDLKTRQPEPALEGDDDFELLVSKKPSRPPPPRPAAGPRIPAGLVDPDEDDEFALEASDDPFDTGFVERVLPATAKEDDDFDPRAEEGLEEDEFDFDPRAEEAKTPVRVKTPDLFSAEENTSSNLQVVAHDLLSGSNTDLSNISQTPLEITASASGEEFIDPFDTSAVNSIVAPGKTELRYLEEELLAGGGLKHSLSDPDFDPRAGGESPAPPEDFTSIAQRKSSLSLHINGAAAKNKTVGFAVPTPDLLKIDGDNSITKKPLTPYYNRESSIPESDLADPFDTSFVPSSAPTQLELNLLEQELNNATLKHSLSDPDFDPRASTPGVQPQQPSKSDLLGVDESCSQKVLTPAGVKAESLEEIDPFDTSIAVNIQPGSTELKLLESELIPAPVATVDPDILSGSQETGAFFVKVLTPQPSNSIDETEVDPFDTSFANNLGPGKAEIKLLENELID